MAVERIQRGQEPVLHLLSHQGQAIPEVAVVEETEGGQAVRRLSPQATMMRIS